MAKGKPQPLRSITAKVKESEHEALLVHAGAGRRSLTKQLEIVVEQWLDANAGKEGKP